MTSRRWNSALNVRPTLGVLVACGWLAGGCRMLTMSFVDFPVNQLPKFDAATPLAVRFSGDGVYQGVRSAVPIRQISGENPSLVGSAVTRMASVVQPDPLFLDVQVNGQPCTLLLDTGSPVTTLSPRAARRAGVQVSDRAFGTAEKFDPEQGATPLYWGWATNVTIGAFDIRNVPLWVWGRQHEVRLAGIPVYRMDGLLGMDLLQNFVLTLDLSDASVQFRRNLPASDSPVRKVPFRVANSAMLVQAAVNGKPIGEAVVDTGASKVVLLESSVWDRLNLSNEAARVNVQLGEVKLNHVPAVKTDRLHPQTPALIPPSLLAVQGRVTIDFPGKRILCPGRPQHGE